MGFRHQRKVLQAVVALVLVDMMHTLARQKWPLQMQLHNHDVFGNHLPAVCKWVRPRIHPDVTVFVQRPLAVIPSLSRPQFLALLGNPLVVGGATVAAIHLLLALRSKRLLAMIARFHQ